MPAVAVENLLVLPRLEQVDRTEAIARPVTKIVKSHQQLEGAGFPIWRPFPGELSLAEADPFLLLDQAGPMLNGANEAMGAPWHPHRGFETVSYIIDGEVAHHDTNGGGGVIREEGDTQWITAGAGILHDELPTERVFRQGGPVHGVELWVNLPSSLKFTPPKYQSITGDSLRMVTTPDGGALVRIIAGDVGEFSGPGATWTPIIYLHATVLPGAELELPWNPQFSAFVYVLTGRGYAGPELRPIDEHELVVFGLGDSVVVGAAETQTNDANALDVLVLGGLPIRESIEHYGPFVMNSRAEILQAIEDYEQGKLGIIPADQRAPRRFA
ncbi:MAG: pirin [Acidimicrobiaceae bacterium]|jgi:redox-sensitive bicupin YhaK (pirin superfamily)|nr:pirin [Acidimicrobiaceae bacterium]